MASTNGKVDALTPPTQYSNLPGSSSPTENSPLLSPALSSRPSYRQRALSRASGNPLPLAESAPAVSAEELEAAEIERGKYLRRRRTKIAIGAIAAFLLLSGIILAIVLPLTIGRRGKGGSKDDGKKDTPDFTRLPPPRDGLRNPNYLVNGWNGAVASEEARCSQIGVDSEFLLSRFAPSASSPPYDGTASSSDRHAKTIYYLSTGDSELTTFALLPRLISFSSARQWNCCRFRHRNCALRRSCQLVLVRNRWRRISRDSTSDFPPPSFSFLPLLGHFENLLSSYLDRLPRDRTDRIDSRYVHAGCKARSGGMGCSEGFEDWRISYWSTWRNSRIRGCLQSLWRRSELGKDLPTSSRIGEGIRGWKGTFTKVERSMDWER